MHAGVALGAVWMTADREIDVIAAEPERVIRFELVEAMDRETEGGEEEVSDIAERSETPEPVEPPEIPESLETLGPPETPEPEETAVTTERQGDGRSAVQSMAEEVERHESPAVPEEAAAMAEPEAAAGDAERARVVAPPKAHGRIMPVYPKSARRKGREGRVVIEARVDAVGGVESARVVASSGYAELDASAVKAVKTASFVPAVEGDQPIAGEIRMTFEFKLTK